MTDYPGRSARRRSAPGNPAWFERALLAAGTVGRGPAMALLAALLAVTWLVVWSTGGTRGASPHLFYVPIIAAALRFGPWALSRPASPPGCSADR